MSAGVPMVPESEIKAETHKSGHHVLDLVLGGSALFVSLCSLGLAIHSGHAMDELVQANSRPVLVFESGNVDPEAPAAERTLDARGMLFFSVVNPGAGSARIEWATLDLDGKPVNDWGDAIKLVRERGVAKGDVPATETQPVHEFVLGSLGHSYLKAGGSRYLFTWHRPPGDSVLWKAADRARYTGALHLTACYCSIFEQCWLADSNVTWPKPVRSCAAVHPLGDASL